MNKLRRKRLAALLEQIETIKDLLDEVKDEEQDCLDNMPENLRGTERYEKIETAVSTLEDALESLESAADSIEEAME